MARRDRQFGGGNPVGACWLLRLPIAMARSLRSHPRFRRWISHRLAPRAARPDPRLRPSPIGYAVFPTVSKGAIGVGGAIGSGVVFEKGKAIGKASLTQVTVGAQLGGQTYSEVIFFETPPAFTDFKKGTLALAAQASAVAASKDASANAKYENGVAVFTTGKGGLMFEASVGGQKFAFEPFGKK